jgi:hypothetical protein
MHLVAAVAEVLQALEILDGSSIRSLSRMTSPRRGTRSATRWSTAPRSVPGARRQVVEHLQHLEELAPHRARRHAHERRLVEGDQPHGVVLAQQQVAERSGQVGRVTSFLGPAGIAAEVHAGRAVDQHRGAQVRLLGEDLQVVPVGFA